MRAGARKVAVFELLEHVPGFVRLQHLGVARGAAFCPEGEVARFGGNLRPEISRLQINELAQRFAFQLDEVLPLLEATAVFAVVVVDVVMAGSIKLRQLLRGADAHVLVGDDGGGLLRQFAIAFEGGKEKDKHLVREAIASFNARNPSNRILQIHLAQSISAWKARQTGTQAHPERISE